MKKIVVLFMMVFALTSGSFAQKGEMGLGGNLSYNTDYEMTGLGVRFQYGLTDRLRMAPQFTYFFENDDMSAFSFDFDLHYMFPLEHQLTLYPIFGLDFTSVDNVGSDSGFGVNAGVGIQFPLCDALSLGAEYKRSVLLDLNDMPTVAFAVVYKF